MNKISSLIISFAYMLEDSQKYRAFKTYFYNILINPTSKSKKYFDFFMIFLIVFSVTVLVIEVDVDLPEWLIFIDYTVITIIFIIEYLLRLWLHDNMHKFVIEEYEHLKFLGHKFRISTILKQIFMQKIRYIFSLSSIIDLLAILPNFRALRVLRIFVLFRVFKLLKHAKNLNSLFSILIEKKVEFVTLLYLVIFFILVSSVIIYVIEGNGINPNIDNFFDAVYWSLVTMTTVGYGDIAPVTDIGRGISLFIIITGVIMLSFSTSIVVSAFSEKLWEMKEDRIINNVDTFDSFFLVIGYSKISEIVTQTLKQHNHKFLIIDNDLNVVKHVTTKKYDVIHADGTMLETYTKLNISNVKTALCLTNSDIINLSMVLTLRTLNKHINIIVKANKKHNIPKLKLAGATTVFDGYKLAGEIANEYEGSSVAFDSIYSVLSEEGGIIDEYKIVHSSPLINKPLSNLDIEKYHLLLLGIKREHIEKIFFNPKDDFILAKNDTLILMGDEKVLHFFKTHIQLKEI